MSLHWPLNNQITKQNCMSVSNQTDSLLVTSSIRDSNHKQHLITTHKQNNSSKKQNKLNSDYSFNQPKRQSIQSSQFVPFSLSSRIDKPKSSPLENMKDKDNKNSTKYTPNNLHNEKNLIQTMLIQQCSHCKQQLPLINQKLSHTISRIQQLQSIIKLCFTKTMALESTAKESNRQLIDVRMRVEESQRTIKKKQHSLLKTNVSTKMQFNQLKQQIEKLSQGLIQKTKQINEIIQLQRIQLNQKLQKLSIDHELRFEALISMVQQLAKSQQHSQGKTISNNSFKSNIQNTTHTKRDSLWFVDSAYQQLTEQKQQQPLLPSNNKHSYYHTHRRQERTRCESSKSKISYYLSKSNFNDATTLCDTMINPLECIKGE